MPRQPKPFFHRGWWVTDIGGRRTKLAHGRHNRKLADQVFHEMLAKRGDQEPLTVHQIAVWELCDQFLDHVKINRSTKTFRDYHDCLKPWVKLHGTRLARDLRALDLERWKGELVGAGLSPCTVNHHLIAVQTCWNWGVKMELLPSSPFRVVEKLQCDGRQRVLTPEEFRALLRFSDALFRQVLLVFRLTGVRPGEFCRLAWPQVNWEAHCWVIQKHKAKRTMKEPKPRIILMPPVVENLLRWRQRTSGDTPRVFLNEDGKPWTTNALRCRMRRARDRAGLAPDENGEQVVMYTARHTYATTAVASGIADRRLAELLGHTNPKTTQRYIHLATPDLYRAAVEATKGYMSPK